MAKDGKMNWKRTTKRKWPKACWIAGDGPYASLAHCRDLTVQLYDDILEALLAKATIDSSGCGGSCHRRHEIIDLRTNERITRKLTPADYDVLVERGSLTLV